MSENKVTGKRKSKKYFIKKSFANTHSIEIGQRGFLCSCNNREKDCIKESYNILNQYSEKLYGTPEKAAETDDINESLDAELKALKDSQQPNQKTFQAIESGARNLLFVKTSLSDPVTLAHEIVKDIHETKAQQTRFLLRMVPIETVCKANVDDITAAFVKLAEKHFSESERTFAIVFNHRNNNSVSKDDVIKSIADKVFETKSGHKVDLKNAQVSIIVEVIKSFAFLAVVPDYIKYKKYNLLAASEQDGVKDVSKNAPDTI